jgi:hypothetical protein
MGVAVAGRYERSPDWSSPVGAHARGVLRTAAFDTNVSRSRCTLNRPSGGHRMVLDALEEADREAPASVRRFPGTPTILPSTASASRGVEASNRDSPPWDASRWAKVCSQPWLPQSVATSEWEAGGHDALAYLTPGQRDHFGALLAEVARTMPLHGGVRRTGLSRSRCVGPARGGLGQLRPAHGDALRPGRRANRLLGGWRCTAVAGVARAASAAPPDPS